MRTIHVSWRQPYIITAVSIGLLFGQETMDLTAGWHKVLEIAVVFGMFGLLARWLARNEAALEDEDLRRAVADEAARSGQFHLTAVQTNYLVAEARRAERIGRGVRPLFLPDDELGGPRPTAAPEHGARSGNGR